MVRGLCTGPRNLILGQLAMSDATIEGRVYAWEEENEDGVEDPEIAKIRAELGEQVPISIDMLCRILCFVQCEVGNSCLI